MLPQKKSLLITAVKREKVKILRERGKDMGLRYVLAVKIIFMLENPGNLPPGLRPQKLRHLRDLYLR